MSSTVGYAQKSDYRRPSLNLWHDCFAHGKGEGELIGAGTFLGDDFTKGILTGRQVITALTPTGGAAGDFTMLDAANGIAVADSGTDDDGEYHGVQVQWGGGSTTGEMFIPAANRTIWLETFLTFSVGIPRFFFGFALQDTTLVASNALTSQGLGFQSFTDDSVILGVAKDGSSTTTASSIKTITADTYVKLGLKVTGTSLVEFFVDGVKKSSTITANIPTTEMRLSLVCNSPAVQDSNAQVRIDWFKVFATR